MKWAYDRLETESSAMARGEKCVRLATLSDIDRIVEIENGSFSSPWSKSSLEKEISGKEWSRTVVASLDGEVAGFMIYWTVVSELHLLNLAVHPSLRRLGIATLLLEHLIDVALQERCPDIFLEVRASNRKAQLLYEKCGFKPIGIRHRYYSDNGEDAIVMCRRRDG